MLSVNDQNMIPARGAKMDAVQTPILLTCGVFVLEISPRTGKIMGLRTRTFLDKNLLVDGFSSERSAALAGMAAGRSVYDSSEAWGVDECFPTIAENAQPLLRDHGALWGQWMQSQTHNPNEISSVWDLSSVFSVANTLNTEKAPDRPCVFKRKIWVEHTPADSNTATFHFEVQFPRVLTDASSSSVQIQSLYASHALFEAQANDLFSVFAGKEVLYSEPFPPAEKREANKRYFSHPALRAILVRPALGLKIEIVCEQNLPHLGIWWCNNGWGDGRDHRTIGIQPTNFASGGPLFLSDTHSKTPAPELLSSSYDTCRFTWVLNSSL